MRDGKNLVSTVMEKVKTFIPSRKSTNRVGKKPWNKDWTFFLYVCYMFPICCYILLRFTVVLLVFAMFRYDFL